MLALLRFINNKSRATNQKAEQSQGFAGSILLLNNLRWACQGYINKKKYTQIYTNLVYKWVKVVQMSKSIKKQSNQVKNFVESEQRWGKILIHTPIFLFIHCD